MKQPLITLFFIVCFVRSQSYSQDLIKLEDVKFITDTQFIPTSEIIETFQFVNVSNYPLKISFDAVRNHDFYNKIYDSQAIISYTDVPILPDSTGFIKLKHIVNSEEWGVVTTGFPFAVIPILDNTPPILEDKPKFYVAQIRYFVKNNVVPIMDFDTIIIDLGKINNNIIDTILMISYKNIGLRDLTIDRVIYHHSYIEILSITDTLIPNQIGILKFRLINKHNAPMFLKSIRLYTNAINPQSIIRITGTADRE